MDDLFFAPLRFGFLSPIHLDQMVDSSVQWKPLILDLVSLLAEGRCF